MNELTALQQRFQRKVMAAPDAPSMREDIDGRLEIYVNAYQGRLREALADNYPVLYRALGDDAFRELAAAYIDAYPSRFRTIRWFGDRMEDFMADRPDLVPHPALRDLAAMDWTMRGAFDAADAELLEFGDLAGLAAEQWPGLRFTPVPSFRLLRLEWGIEELWHALNDDQDAETEEPQPLAHAMIVWRKGLECRWRTVSDAEALALDAMCAGGCFADICAALDAASEQDAATRAAHLLQTWIADGLLAAQASATNESS